MRPQYAEVREIARRLTPEQREIARRDSLRLTENDFPVNPVPRLFTASEMAMFKKGTAQRAEALRRFMVDYYSGTHGYTAVIPREKVEKIVERYRMSGYAGQLDPAHIAFPYGPDIMRDQGGDPFIIEDNVGYVGGPEDLPAIRSTFEAIAPQYRGAIAHTDDPVNYFRALIAAARRHAIPADGKIVSYNVGRDASNARLDAIMAAEGVEPCSPTTARKLVCSKEGAFLESKGPDGQVARERVGFIILRGEHQWLDPTHPITRRGRLLDEARWRLSRLPEDHPRRAELQALSTPDAAGQLDLDALEPLLESLSPGWNSKPTLPGLMDALLAGTVATNHSPGVDFVGDKEFKGYVDGLIRHYLHQEPILPSVPVEGFTAPGPDGKPVLDGPKLERMFADQDYQRHVFKRVTGRAGDGVFIGPKLTPEAAADLAAQIAAEPEAFTAEPFKQLSTHDGHIVDVRVLANAMPGEIVIGPTPLCRGAPLDGSGKVNVAQNGTVFSTYVTPDPAPRLLRSRSLPTLERARPRSPAV